MWTSVTDKHEKSKSTEFKSNVQVYQIVTDGESDVLLVDWQVTCRLLGGGSSSSSGAWSGPSITESIPSVARPPALRRAVVMLAAHRHCMLTPWLIGCSGRRPASIQGRGGRAGGQTGRYSAQRPADAWPVAAGRGRLNTAPPPSLPVAWSRCSQL